MLAKALVRSIAEQILVYDAPEAEEIAAWLAEAYYGIGRKELVLNQEIDAASFDLQAVLSRINAHEPVQYVIGKSYFYGLEFWVNNAVLIPRPETEELVALVLKKVANNQSIKLLDVGTGSGCIAVTLAKKLPKAVVSAYDVSAEAIEVAQKNAEFNGVKVAFEVVDILKKHSQVEAPYDVIVSNPPYIEKSEAATMRPNVLDYEPRLALFVENPDPLLFYKAIADFGLKNLKPNGQLFFEINEAFGEATAEVLRQRNYHSVEIHQDIYRKNRMISAVKM